MSSNEKGHFDRSKEQRRLELVDEGRSWLELLDERVLIGTSIVTRDGRQFLAEEFPLIYPEELYEERVHPLYLALQSDPNNEKLKEALRQMLHQHLIPPEEVP